MNIDKIAPSFFEKLQPKSTISKEIEKKIGKNILNQLILARKNNIRTILSFSSDNLQWLFLKHRRLKLSSVILSGANLLGHQRLLF